ncbi:MAG: GAF domain-containing protein [Thermodesulfobacteriota bacterium]
MTKKLFFLWFFVSLAIIGVMEWLAYHNTVQLIQAGEQAFFNLQMLSTINALESHLLDAESASRGFIITGKETHLDRFNQASCEASELLSQLRTLARNEAERQEHLEHLEPLIKRKVLQMNNSVQSRQQKGLQLAEQVDLTEEGKDLRDAIRQTLEGMKQAEKRNLLHRVGEKKTNAEFSLKALIQATILSYAILFAIFWLLIREIQARARAESSLQRANRTLKTLSESRQVLAKAVDEPELLREICRILVEDGRYPMAWVGLADPHQKQAVRPLASYGVEDGYLELVTSKQLLNKKTPDPFWEAISTGQPRIIRSLTKNDSSAPWRSEALKRGFASLAVFPLRTNGRIWGGLTIYGGEPDAFDSKEVKLLTELAADLEFGIDTLRTRSEHRRAEQALQASEEQYRLLVDNLNHGLIIVNPQGVFTFVNPRFCEMLSSSSDAIIGHHAKNFLDLDNWEILKTQLAGEPKGGNNPYELVFTKNNGEKVITLVTPMPIFNPSVQIQSSFAVITDITARKQAEAQAQEHLHSLGLLIAGVEKLAKIRDPDVMVQEICQLVVEAFDTQLVWLGRLEAGNRITPLYWSGEHSDCLKEFEMRLDNPILEIGPTGRALQTRVPVLLNHLNHTDDQERQGPAVQNHSYQSLGAFPLIRDQQAFACLNIYSRRPNFFTPERVDLLQAFASISAAAMENARLSAKAEKHLKQIQALRQIELAISGSLDLRITLNVLLDKLTEQLKVDAAAIMLFNPHTLTLEYGAGQGFRSNTITHFRIPLGKGFSGKVALERLPLFIPDLKECKDKDNNIYLLSEEEFLSYYGVPLINKGQIKGIIEIYHRSRFNADEEVMEFLEALTGQAAVAIDNATLVNEMQRSHIDLSLAYEATLEGWAKALELRDFETKGHSQRVTTLTIKLARALGVSDRDLAHVYRGALLHDIGKIAVPDSILRKTGPLTPDEWSIMRQHPFYAYELLSPITYLRPALDIPFCHHERWDGSGYPRGLRGEDIPLGARIFAIADVWDALCSDRPYRRSWPHTLILDYLKDQAGKLFDPHIVEVFIEKILPELDATEDLASNS